MQVCGVPPGAVSGGPGLLPVPPQPEVPGTADGRDPHGVEQRGLHLQPRHGQHLFLLVLCLVALNKDVSLQTREGAGAVGWRSVGLLLLYAVTFTLVYLAYPDPRLVGKLNQLINKYPNKTPLYIYFPALEFCLPGTGFWWW